MEEARKAAEERRQEAISGKCALADELDQVKRDLMIKSKELSFAIEDIKGLESQLQQLAQGSSDNLGHPLPAAAPVPAGDNDVGGGGRRPRALERDGCFHWSQGWKDCRLGLHFQT